MYKLGFIAVCSLATIGGCVDDGEDGATGPAGAAGTAGAEGTGGAAGSIGPAGPQLALPGVYTLANAAGPNQVAAYIRASNGNLSRKGGYATAGAGLGAGLGSQGAIVFDAALQRFFAVNPGDDTISMLAIDAGGNLTMMSKVASGGKRPISITAYGDTVYVVNRGDAAAAVAGNISGFKAQSGSLAAIAGSTKPLSAPSVNPTDIAFTPDGKFLVVAERGADKLDTFAVTNGVAQAGNFQTSSGMQPFAFDFSPEGYLLVAEVGTGGPTTSSVSSYSISATGTLTPVTQSLATNQGAACWIVMAGGHAYVANAASGTITGLNVAVNGTLELHEQSGVTATPGPGAIDLAVTPDRGFLYSLGGNPRTISIYEIGSDGSLTARAPLTGVPAFAAGLVAR